MDTSIKAHVPTAKTPLIGSAVAALLLVALGLFLSSASRRRATTISPAEPVATAQGDIPPIDSSAPADTETATFGLG